MIVEPGTPRWHLSLRDFLQASALAPLIKLYPVISSYFQFFLNWDKETWVGLFFLQFSSVHLLSRVRLFATSWTAACQASLSFTNSQSSPKPMSIELVMPSNHLILVVPFSSCPQSFPASGSFQMSQLFVSGGQNIGVSASASVPPMNI